MCHSLGRSPGALQDLYERDDGVRILCTYIVHVHVPMYMYIVYITYTCTIMYVHVHCISVR